MSCSQNQKSKEGVEVKVETREFGRSNDRTFLSLVLEMSMEDVKLARLAQERTNKESVLQFAKKIEAGHTMVINHIRVFSEKKGIPLTVSTPEENEYQALIELEGNSFDQEFCGYMAKEHENAIDSFENAAADEFMDADIKTWADSMIPVFRSNMETASMLLSENERL